MHISMAVPFICQSTEPPNMKYLCEDKMGEYDGSGSSVLLGDMFFMVHNPSSLVYGDVTFMVANIVLAGSLPMEASFFRICGIFQIVGSCCSMWK